MSTYLFHPPRGGSKARNEPSGRGWWLNQVEQPRLRRQHLAASSIGHWCLHKHTNRCSDQCLDQVEQPRMRRQHLAAGGSLQFWIPEDTKPRMRRQQSRPNQHAVAAIAARGVFNQLFPELALGAKCWRSYAADMRRHQCPREGPSVPDV